MRQMRFYRPIMRRIRDYNITKKEWVLNGEMVISVADSRIRRGKYQNDGSVFYQIKPSRASELLKEMLECGIVEPVSGHGKGKYRFRKEQGRDDGNFVQAKQRRELVERFLDDLIIPNQMASCYFIATTYWIFKHKHLLKCEV